MYQAFGLMICLQHGWWAVLWQDSVLTVKWSICQASRLLTWYTCTCVHASLVGTRNTMLPWTFGICYVLCSLVGFSLEWTCFNALMTAMPMSMKSSTSSTCTVAVWEGFVLGFTLYPHEVYSSLFLSNPWQVATKVVSMQACSGCSSFMQDAGCFDTHVKPNGLMHISVVQAMGVLHMSLVKPMVVLHMSLVKPMGLLHMPLVAYVYMLLVKPSGLMHMVWVLTSSQTCIM